MKNETRSETRKPCVISLGEYRAKRTTAPPGPPAQLVKLLEQRRGDIAKWAGEMLEGLGQH